VSKEFVSQLRSQLSTVDTSSDNGKRTGRDGKARL
jgi:hypothetical protein